MNQQAEKLEREDLADNIVIIKINKMYRPNMSDEELYEATRGAWKRKIESVEKADYCLAVSNGIVVEVYEIDEWMKAGAIPMKTREIEPEKLLGRIEFIGEKANEVVRKKYIGKSVANLYKSGEANPVKVFLKDFLLKRKSTDINIETAPILIIETEETPLIICPSCEATFEKAPRCPECGQLIKYSNGKQKKLNSLDEWAKVANITEGNPYEVITFVENLVSQSEWLGYHIGTKDVSIDYILDGKEKLQLMMLFGNERCGAIQPSEYVRFFNNVGLSKNLLDDYLNMMKSFLSRNQKNKPYERMNGYYFLDYVTILEKQEELEELILAFCKSIS